MTIQQQQKLDLILSKVGDLNFRRRIITLLDYLDIQSEDKVLDAGCGEGFYVMILREIFDCEVWAIDYDPHILEMAKKWFHRDDKKIHWQQADLTALSFKDESFDKIICSEVLEHIPEDGRAVSELYRVLKKGGKIGATVPNHNYPFLWDPLNWIRERLELGHFNADNGFWGGIWALGHQRLYYPYEIKHLLENEKFKVQKMKGLTHYGVPFNHMILYLGKQFYSRLPVPESVRQAMEKFEWKPSEKKSKSFVSVLLNSVLALFKWVDHFNDDFDSLKASSMAVAVLGEK